MSAIKEVFGDGITGMNTVTSRDPHSFKDLLLSPDSSVRSCFIVMESTKMKEELLTKSNRAVYQDLLKTASWTVGKNIFSPFCLHTSQLYLMHLEFFFDPDLNSSATLVSSQLPAENMDLCVT